MKKRIKKIISTSLLALTLAGAGGSIASAATVYYKGSAVYWNYGRTVGLWSYSHVQSGVYEHAPHFKVNIDISGFLVTVVRYL